MRAYVAGICEEVPIAGIREGGTYSGHMWGGGTYSGHTRGVRIAGICEEVPIHTRGVRIAGICEEVPIAGIREGVRIAGICEEIPIAQEIARGHSALQGRFLGRRCFTLCITVEVEPRVAKQYKFQYCCGSKNYRGKGMECGKKVSFRRFFFFCWPEDHEFVEKMRFGASYSTSNKSLLTARHIMTTGLQKCL